MQLPASDVFRRRSIMLVEDARIALVLVNRDILVIVLEDYAGRFRTTTAAQFAEATSRIAVRQNGARTFVVPCSAVLQP